MRRDIARLKQEVAHWKEQAAAVQYLPAPSNGARGCSSSWLQLPQAQMPTRCQPVACRSKVHVLTSRCCLLRPLRCAEEEKAEHERQLAEARAEAQAKEAAAAAEVGGL